MSKPHVGTDKLRDVVRNMRQELQQLGCEVRFETRLESLKIKDGRICGAYLSDGKTQALFESGYIVLAPGHSARDTFTMLHGVRRLRCKASALPSGRVSSTDRLPSPRRSTDPLRRTRPFQCLVISSALICRADARSFPSASAPEEGVVAAASEEGFLVTNGMSRYARDEENINGALLVGVGPEDFGNDHPLAGVQYQRELEKRAFAAGGGGFHAPAQRAEDFLLGRKSRGFGDIHPSYRPGVLPADLSSCLPPDICSAIQQALPLFERKIKGFAYPDAGADRRGKPQLLPGAHSARRRRAIGDCRTIPLR